MASLEKKFGVGVKIRVRKDRTTRVISLDFSLTSSFSIGVFKLWRRHPTNPVKEAGGVD
jgi:hypothetical protein